MKTHTHTVWKLFVAGIFIVAVFFRVYNYTNRVVVVSDHTRDLSVAYYAATHHLIPQIGQFSSAGPFFYGPWWYWFLGLVSFLPFGVLTHWYVMTFLSLAFIGMNWYLGNQVGGKWLGIIAALFAAVSPSQIDNSMSVWNPAIVPFLSLIVLILLIKCYETQRWKYFFVLGFSLGITATIHFQTILLLPVLLTGIFCARKKLLNVIPMVIGFFLPFLPLLYFDLRFHWFESRNVWYYLTVGQYAIWVPNRWLLYAGKYWPDTWSSIVGGTFTIGGLLIIILSLFTIFKLPRSKTYGKFYLVATTFVLEIILFRYYRGERYVYYSFWAHPYVFLLSAWIVLELIKFNKFIGLTIFFIVTLFTVPRATRSLASADIRLATIQTTNKEIYQVYPNDSFDIYGCYSTMGNLVAYPVAYFMYRDGRNDLNGRKIGVCFEGQGKIRWEELKKEQVRKGNSSWFNRSTEQVYRETAEWWKESPPK